MQPTPWQDSLRIAIAGLIGLAIGTERQWSGHASGPDARFAGMRTLFMLGLVGGVAGLLMDRGLEFAASALVAGGVALAIVAFVLASRRPDSEVDATTEVAAIVAIALGALAGLGSTVLAAGAASVVVLALSEKARLHGTVGKLEEAELRAALRFAALALVVLPVLPARIVVSEVELNPRALWAIVLFFSALNFAAFIARRLVAPNRGYGVAGALGGFISSTAVTLLYARRSRSNPELAKPLSGGVIAACTVLVPRVIAVSAVISPAVSWRLLPYIGPALLAGLGLTLWSVRTARETVAANGERGSPLRLRLAMQMAVAFQVAMLAIEYVRANWSLPGLYFTAAFLGLTDVDALTVSMSRMPDDLSAAVAARAIAVGILANTLFKSLVATALGAGAFRWRTAAGLLLMATTIIAALSLV